MPACPCLDALMRRSLLLAATLLAAACTLPATGFAQGYPGGGGGGPGGGGQRGGRGQQDDGADAAKKKKKDAEWGDAQAPLPALRNAGPCPFVKVLYDAGRYVEFKDGKEASADVGYT